ncbi:hypothetical protein BGZ67_004720 [Mortierella alpina]|nr:hypothetical protein BGZ67_004720 [Mortierella alpina]
MRTKLVNKTPPAAVQAPSWKHNCVDKRFVKPACTGDSASDTDPAPAIAGAVDSDEDHNIEDAAATVSATITTTTPSTTEGCSPDGDATPSVVPPQENSSSDDAARSAMDDSEDVGEPVSHYIKVPYKQHRANCMIATAAFGEETSSLKIKLQRLLECLSGIAIPLRAPAVRHMLQEDKSSVPFFLLEIGETAEREALQNIVVNSPDGAQSWQFLPLSVDQQSWQILPLSVDQENAEESRSIDIRSLQYDTKNHHIKAALSKYGLIERVEMGFNKIKSMATARVVFTTANSVTSMINSGITCILVGQNSGLIARLGETRPDIDHELTLKLTHLPFGCTPRDVAEALADFSYYGITMPLDPNTRRRKMEAFVYFSHSLDQETAREQDFQLGKEEKVNAWAETNASTCYGCGAVGHRSNKCATQQHQLSIRQLRQKNANLISRTKTQKAPVHQSARQPMTKAQITAAKGKGKATSPPPASAWTTAGNFALQHAPASGKAPAATTSSQQSQPAWKADHNAMLQQVRQASMRLDKKMAEREQLIQRQFQQVDSRMMRMEHMFQTYFAQAAPVRKLPPTSVSCGKIVDIAQESAKQTADLHKNLAQARMELEHHHRAMAAVQNELASVKDIVVAQREYIQRSCNFTDKQASQATQISHVSNTPQSQQGVSPMPQVSGSQLLQQTIPWSVPGAPFTYPIVPSSPNFSSQGGLSQATANQESRYFPQYSQHTDLEDSIHYSPAAPSGGMDTTDSSRTQSQEPFFFYSMELVGIVFG